MADPKYADLPGIAHGEPDVYETSDLPESDQTSDFYEEENEAIEKLHLSANDAFKKFKGKTLDATKVDFSDRITKLLRTGYDWELLEKGHPETPLQKYQRLQCEIKELFEEVDKIKVVNDENTNCMVTGEQVQHMLTKLQELRLEEALGADVISSVSDPQGTQLRKLMAQLEEFKANAVEKPEGQTSASESGIVYQLNYKPEHARFAQSNRLADLEKRLYRLETVLGSSSDKLSRLSTMTSKGSLIETAQHLSATASMLDSTQLDHIEGRLTALVQMLDTISEKRSKVSEDAEKDKMILELYEVVKNSDDISKVLLKTVERLKSLEALHNKATDFTKTLAHMEKLQGEVVGNIANNKALLQGVQESFAINYEAITKTIQNFDTRIKAFEKK